MRATTIGIDVGAVRFVVPNDDFGAELAQNTRRRFVSGTVRDINRDAHSFKRHLARETLLREFDVTSKRVIDARRTTDFACSRADVVDLAGENKVLDLRFDLIVEFVTVVAKKLNAVVFVRIVRGGKNDASIRTQ